MDASQGDVKRQVANTAKAVMATYKFQTMGEYRALLSLYNVTVEEARGNVDGCEYHGLVYAATDDAGTEWAILSRHPVSGSPSAMKPCCAGLSFPKADPRQASGG